MAATNDFENDGLRRPLAWSAGLHVAFTVFVVLWATYITGIRGQGWGSGGGGDAMGATLVTSVPLPANPVQTTNVVATESKGLTQSQPKVEEKEPDAIPIPDKKTKKKNKPVISVTPHKAVAEPPETNQILTATEDRSAVLMRCSTRAGQRADLDLLEEAAISAADFLGMCKRCSERFPITGYDTRSIPASTKRIGCI